MKFYSKGSRKGTGSCRNPDPKRSLNGDAGDDGGDGSDGSGGGGSPYDCYDGDGGGDAGAYRCARRDGADSPRRVTAR